MILKKNFKSLLIVLFSIILFKTIDILFFDVFIWAMPDESAWSTNFFFGYEHHFRELKKKPKNKPLVLIIGSSIAAYSLSPKDIQDYLSKSGMNVQVEILTYAGMTPIDTILLSKKFLSLNPDLIVYPVNFIDFRIHREMSIRHRENERWKTRFLLEDTLHYGEAPQSKIFYPLETILEFYSILSIEKIAEYLAAYLVYSYRYKDVYYENLKAVYQHRFGRNTSYHGYMGVEIPEGIDSLGWTSKKFSFYPKPYMKEKGFYVQVVPEILNGGILKIEFFSQEGKLLQEEQFFYPAWHKIILKKDIPEDQMITAKLSQIWYAYQAQEDRLDFHRDEMGVRLQQNFGYGFPPPQQHFERPPRKEDFRYENMNFEEYKEYFFYRLFSHPEFRPGIIYFSSIYESKKWVSSQNFEPNPQYEYLLKWKSILEKSNVSMILINNPENPITLELYENSDWYKDQLEYLKKIQSKEIEFIDIKNMCKAQDFSDFHHFTYPAMKGMNVVYSNFILRKLREKEKK